MEHILNETELNEAYDEIKSVDEKLTILAKRKGEINQMLIQNSINKAKNQFQGIEFGDKVKVIRKVYEWRNPNATETVIRYMGNFFLYHYVGNDYLNYDKYIKLELYQVKKDGTRSLRKDENFVSSIVSIEKVEE